MINNVKEGAFNKLSNILSGSNRLIIPDLQRDFCWGGKRIEGKKASLVSNFTSDLVNIATIESVIKEYSLGIIFVYEYPKSFLYLCDGQQRITTLFLIIGVLYCYEPNESLKSMLLLGNEQPRLKYEVRNSTDYFIQDLIKNVFLNQKINALNYVTKSHWYRDEYANDPSIKSMISAIEEINTIVNVSNANLIANYILESIGFVFITLKANNEDTSALLTKTREYGEKMYEIVNTSGDPMEKNEHQKSIQLSKLPVEKRREATEKWEIWQDFFWQNRPENQESADESFNAFLGWIEEIEKDKELSVDIIESYFKAFFLLVGIQDRLSIFRKYQIVNIKAEFIKNNKPQALVLYPCLIKLRNTDWVSFDGTQYIIKYNEVDYDNLYRYVRYFSNVSRNSTAKEEAVQLAKSINQKEDVIDFLSLGDRQFGSILSEEEKFKLQLYKKCINVNERFNWEDLLWRAEDHNYLFGKIKPLINCLGISLNEEISNNFKTTDFVKIFQFFCNVISDDSIEKLRMTLFLFCPRIDMFRNGWSWGVERYYLGKADDNNFWRKWIQTEMFKKNLSLVYEGSNLDKILAEGLSSDIDANRKKIIRFLLNRSKDIFQWQLHKQFFIYGSKICFPNGVQAKENTFEASLI